MKMIFIQSIELGDRAGRQQGRYGRASGRAALLSRVCWVNDSQFLSWGAREKHHAEELRGGIARDKYKPADTIELRL